MKIAPHIVKTCKLTLTENIHVITMKSHGFSKVIYKVLIKMAHSVGIMDQWLCWSLLYSIELCLSMDYLSHIKALVCSAYFGAGLRIILVLSVYSWSWFCPFVVGSIKGTDKIMPYVTGV